MVTPKYTDVMRPEDISIAYLWTMFAGAVLDANAPEIQRTEMRRAFYAGFVECFKITTDIATGLPEAQSYAVLSRISGEAVDFFNTMMSENGIR